MKNSGVFTICDSLVVIIYSRGVYKQSECYLRGNVLHAKVGGGYVVMKEDKSTSSPAVRWDEICSTTNEEPKYKRGYLGWLEID